MVKLRNWIDEKIDDTKLKSTDRILNTNQRYIRKGGWTEITQPEADFKPHGLWYGFENSWIEWLRAEQPDWERIE